MNPPWDWIYDALMAGDRERARVILEAACQHITNGEEPELAGVRLLRLALRDSDSGETRINLNQKVRGSRPASGLIFARGEVL